MAKRKWLQIEDQGYGIVVEKELLGQMFAVSLPTSKAIIILPEALDRFTGVECVLTLKQLTSAGFKVTESMQGQFESLNCGIGSSYGHSISLEELKSAELRKFVYILEKEWTSDESVSNETLREEWDNYWALCKDWLEALTEQDTYSGSTPSSKGRQYGVWIEIGDGAEAQHHAIADCGGSSPLIASRPISRKILECSLDRALEVAQIPLEYRLLRDARRSINLGDFRKSVIDCGSAIEVVLSRELIRLYGAAKKPQKTVDHLAKHGTLGVIIDAWNLEGTTKFPKLNASVADLRNDIIHRGAKCTAEEAMDIYEIGRKVLETEGAKI